MKLTEFILPGCPYCSQMEEILRELHTEEQFAALEIECVDETREPERAGECDYYYCPSFFCGTQKIYEAVPGRSREQSAAVLREALLAFIKEQN